MGFLIEPNNANHEEKRFQCDRCGKKFAQNSLLKIHYRSHTDERPFDCEICGKSFHQSSHLRYHQLSHSKARKYKCAICGKEMRYKQSLGLHLRIHNEEKKYTCDVCGKSFHEKPKLKIHQRIHTGEKPYLCNICGRAFVQKGNCQKHKQRYHARDLERKFPCHLCSKSFIWKKCLIIHLSLHENSKKECKQTNVNSKSLQENMSRFLPVLMEHEILLEIGWPEISIEDAVAKILIWCELKPEEKMCQRLNFEGNCKLLLNLVLEEKFTEMNDMSNKSTNEILEALLHLSKM